MLIVALGLLLLPAVLGAQTGPAARPVEAADAPEALRACVFGVVDLSPTGQNAQYEALITQQLELELSAAGFKVVPRERVARAQERAGLERRDLVAGAPALQVAAALEAAVALTGFYSVQDERIVLELKVYDVAQRALLAGTMRTGQVNLSMFTLIDGAVAQILPEVRRLAAALAGAQADQADRVRVVTLYSPDEGAEIYLPGDQFLGVIRQGALTLPPVPLALGGTLTVIKKKPGYHDDRETVKLAQPVVEASLGPLVKQTRWATELNYTSAQLMGFGLAQRYYPRPDILFLAGENYLYVQHNFLPENRPVFHDDARLLVGGYPAARVDARFRFGVSTGFGAILTWTFDLDVAPALDPYWNFLNAWIEWNWARTAVFLRSEGRYALGDGGLLGQGMYGNGPVVTAGVMRKW